MSKRIGANNYRSQPRVHDVLTEERATLVYTRSELGLADESIVVCANGDIETTRGIKIPESERCQYGVRYYSLHNVLISERHLVCLAFRRAVLPLRLIPKVTLVPTTGEYHTDHPATHYLPYYKGGEFDVRAEGHVFRRVPGYSDYAVSKEGLLTHLPSGRITRHRCNLNSRSSPTAYIAADIQAVRRAVRVDELKAMAWMAPPPTGGRVSLRCDGEYLRWYDSELGTFLPINGAAMAPVKDLLLQENFAA